MMSEKPKDILYETVHDGDIWHYQWFQDDRPTLSFQMDRFGLILTGLCLEAFLTHPKRDEAYAAAKEYHRKFYAGEIDFTGWPCKPDPYRFQKKQGLWADDGTLIDYDPGYLTIRIVENWYTNEANDGKPFSHHYIDLEWHERIVKEKVAEAMGHLSDIVHRAVSTAVDSSVSKKARGVLDEYRQTLEGIQRERAGLEKRLLELEKMEAKAAERESRKGEQKPRTLAGFVYLLQSASGNYKIGRTKNPDDRLRTFGVKLPFEVEYTCVIATDDMYALEAELHARFDAKWVDGEWFALDEADVQYIKSLVVAQMEGDDDGR